MGGWEFGAGLVTGFILTICVYLFLTTNRREKPMKGFFRWLRDFFTFKKIYIEAILRFLYILTTCIIFSFGFYRIFEKGWRGLIVMIAGPVIVRIAYEILMLGILAVKNLMEINNLLQGKGSGTTIMADPDAFNAALQRRADELGEAFVKKAESAGQEETAPEETADPASAEAVPEETADPAPAEAVPAEAAAAESSSAETEQKDNTPEENVPEA